MNRIGISLVVASALGMMAVAGCERNRTTDSTGTNDRTEQRSSSAADAIGKQVDGARTFIDDATITTKLKAEIVKDDALKVSQIDITTTQGVVRLSGAVDTPAAVARAEELAHGIEGVKRVENGLTAKRAS